MDDTPNLETRYKIYTILRYKAKKPSLPFRMQNNPEHSN